MKRWKSHRIRSTSIHSRSNVGYSVVLSPPMKVCLLSYIISLKRGIDLLTTLMLTHCRAHAYSSVAPWHTSCTHSIPCSHSNLPYITTIFLGPCYLLSPPRVLELPQFLFSRCTEPQQEADGCLQAAERNRSAAQPSLALCAPRLRKPTNVGALTRCCMQLSHLEHCSRWTRSSRDCAHLAPAPQPLACPPTNLLADSPGA